MESNQNKATGDQSPRDSSSRDSFDIVEPSETELVADSTALNLETELVADSTALNPETELAADSAALNQFVSMDSHEAPESIEAPECIEMSESNEANRDRNLFNVRSGSMNYSRSTNTKDSNEYSTCRPSSADAANSTTPRRPW